MTSRVKKSNRPSILGWHLCPWNRKLRKEPTLSVAPGYIYYIEPDVPTLMCQTGFHGCTSYERVKAYASMAAHHYVSRAGYCKTENRVWLCRVRLSGDLHYQYHEPWWKTPPTTPEIDKWVAREREVLWMIPLLRQRTRSWQDGVLSIATATAVNKRCRWEPYETLTSFAARCKAANEWPGA